MSHLDRVAFTVAVLVGTSAAWAGFIFDTQTRQVEGRVWAGVGSTYSDTITAPNFGLFDATTHVTDPTYGGSANQHQRSQLLPNLITVIGDTTCYRPGNAGAGQAYARSSFDVNFTVTQPTLVSLEASGSLTGSAATNSRAIGLIGPNADIRWGNGYSPGLFPEVSGTNSTTVTLAPGSWRFLVSLASSDDRFTGYSAVNNFDVRLRELPEPGFLAPALVALLPLIRRKK